MNIRKLNNLSKDNFKFYSTVNNNKASEKYIYLEFLENNQIIWSGPIPYVYRRTGIDINTEKDLIEYLLKIKKYFFPKNIDDFVKTHKLWFEKNKPKAKTTSLFFNKLLNMNWNNPSIDFPNNPNYARRIQDIKEFGFTIATKTNPQQLLLLPIPRGASSGYESINSKTKNKIIQLLNKIDIYEDRIKNLSALIPDHKFPEIRWGKNYNLDNNQKLNDSQLKNKFQLINNERNLQKRERCRECFQTNKRQTLFGINYFYKGDKNWPSNIPKVGEEAENGCVGCGWYDIDKWRKSLNKVLFNK